MEDERARTLKKDDLIAFIVEAAAARQWAPAALGWDRLAEEADAEAEGQEEAAEALELPDGDLAEPIAA